ncbi:MAG: aspartate aminotransferase family protein [Desulfomicrobium sp.]|uniref:aspartate aminotransferase family protein n=1 Tax=Hoeflea sp. TaxID=1940281 RepID=UPI0025BA4B97|nr:aspartate aminotransferase family protein [Hoeflea sp.]MBU4528008.1 aspartate aminotransferase family protein [Alphaproteobacteria bacterium]MBV1712607.1 aspartate aminotransferase family protein [Desulfomicrobium sp.]MBU4542282.1 aspartate aminotransferase family protein [Alphaproteobacteria bacterium]MBU4549014.1 aspartate aminotransferase family protein [Alphaproteobacteria bacterium]MBV1783544.1 aspartate aminotransferase family protein [Hoeflea sp.]
MSHIFPRHTKAILPTVFRGEGVYLYDQSGKAYLDGSGGAAVSCLGHGDVDVTHAIKAQLDRVAFAHTSFFTSEPAEQLADKLIAHAPQGIDRVYLVSGGSEAMEAALKLARQYFVEIGQPQRRHVIARQQSYHGNTLGALATGGNEWRRAPFAPLMVETSHVSPCFEYRGRRDDESAAHYGLRVANELETEIQRLGEDTVFAFVAEPVVGATAGAVPPVDGYFRRIRDICDKYGVLLILDEVMCGMGRTGTLFACEQEGISPDIVAVAKGLGAGYQPIGAMLCSARIYAAFEAGSGFFQHGHTYVGHPVASAAALAVLTKLTDGGLVKRAAEMGERLNDALVSAFGQHPHVGDIRGRGMFRALEIVRDRDTKEPFAPELAKHKALKAAAFEAGLICYPMGGTIDGKRGDHILLAPPFILEDRHIDEIVTKLQIAIGAHL